MAQAVFRYVWMTGEKALSRNHNDHIKLRNFLVMCQAFGRTTEPVFKLRNTHTNHQHLAESHTLCDKEADVPRLNDRTEM
jgi:hypothetical protein